MAPLPGRPDLPPVGAMRATLKKGTFYKNQPKEIVDRMHDDKVAVDYRFLEIAGFLPN